MADGATAVADGTAAVADGAAAVAAVDGNSAEVADTAAAVEVRRVIVYNNIVNIINQLRSDSI